MKTGNEFLQEVMSNQGMNQVELARKTGVTQQTISKLISGVTKTPSRVTALKLAEYFEVSTDEIYREGNNDVL